MRKKTAGLFLAAALFPLGFSLARAVRPLTPPAPEFPSDDAWINAKPLTLDRLKNRRAVLVAFLNTANINSLRAVKILQQWFDLYALEGLMIVGVHTPDYDFQKDPRAVGEALKRFKVAFPVILDADRRLWKAYANDGWPAFHLVDHKSRIIFDRLGENHYEETEAAIRSAVEMVPGYSEPSKPPIAQDPETQDCGAMTGELALGQRHGRMINLSRGGTPETDILAESRDGEVAYRGKWTIEPSSLRLAQKNADLSALVRLIYRGIQVFAVLEPAEGPTRFYVRQDGLWLHSGNAGKNVEFDDDGRSYVTASDARLYELVHNPNDSVHSLSVMPAKRGAAVYDISFADRCLPVALP